MLNLITEDSRFVAPVASERTGPTMLSEREIHTNGGTQMRATVNMDTVMEYADAMKAGAIFPPIIVFYDGAEYWMADGFHRLAAHSIAKPGQPIACDVRSGDQRKAILHAAQANADHGLRRTNADKRRAVETLLMDDEWGKWSDRQIADKCKVSNRFVGIMRAELFPPAEVSQSDTVNGSQYERTFTHPKTGQPTTMKIGNIGGATGKCRKCGRPLTDPEHVANGCGPVCAAKEAAIVARSDEKETHRPLSDEETVIVIYNAMSAMTRGQDRQAAQAWLATHFKVDDYLFRIDRDEEYIDVAAFRTAYARVRTEMGMMGSVKAPPPPPPDPRCERVNRLLDLYRQIAVSGDEYSNLTGDFTGVLPLRRAIEPMIAKLVGLASVTGEAP